MFYSFRIIYRAASAYNTEAMYLLDGFLFKVNRDLFTIEVYKFNQFLTDKWTRTTINSHIFLLISLYFYKSFFRLLGKPDLLCSEIAFSLTHFSNSPIKWSEVNLTSTLTIPRKIAQLYLLFVLMNQIHALE